VEQKLKTARQATAGGSEAERAMETHGIIPNRARTKLVLSVATVALLSALTMLVATGRTSLSLRLLASTSNSTVSWTLSAAPAPARIEKVLTTAALVVAVKNTTGYFVPSESTARGGISYSMAGKESTSADISHRGSSGMRLLIYFITFPKQQHLEMLETCWPALISRGKLLSFADFLVFLGGKATGEELSRWRSAIGKLGVNATLQHDPTNPGYQAGAMRAMHVLMQNGWWRGYDWVVRLYPDVLIYDDAYLQKFFLDPKLSAVLANCGQHIVRDPHQNKRGGLGKVHTDFFAMRPSRIPEAAFADWNKAENAEVQATGVFWDIIERKECAWLLPSNLDKACRIRGS